MMGWGHGTNTDGREIGYLAEAECDKEGCTVAIDRGVYYVCGGMHDGGTHGCGRCFCDEHLGYRVGDDGRLSRDAHGDPYPQLCDTCIEATADLSDGGGTVSEPLHRTIPRRVNDLNNDIALTVGRLDEALELLGIWAETYPDETLQRASRALIKRCAGVDR